MNQSIKYVAHKNIDFSKWDACIVTSQTDFIYADSNVLNILHPNWDGIIVNDYEHVFPVAIAKKFGIPYVFQPHFIQQLGLFGPDESNPDLLDLCLCELQNKFKYIEYNLNHKNNTQNFRSSCIKQVSIALKLDKHYAELKKDYSNNLKRNLVKAQQHNLSITTEIDLSPIINLFRKNRGANLKHLTADNYNRLEKLLIYLKQINKLEILGVVGDNENLKAAIVILNHQSKSIFFFSALSQIGKSESIMPFLIDDFIKRHAESGRTLDFMGSNHSNLARFYKSFGASEYVYLRFINNKLPWPLKLFKK